MDAREEGQIFSQLGLKGSRALFIRGNAEYTIDRVGLKKLHGFMPERATKTIKSAEDNIITLCARKIGLAFGDNRDSCTGHPWSKQKQQSTK